MSHFLSELYPVFVFTHGFPAAFSPLLLAALDLTSKLGELVRWVCFVFLLFLNEIKNIFGMLQAYWQIRKLKTCEETVERSSEILLLRKQK